MRSCGPRPAAWWISTRGVSTTAPDAFVTEDGSLIIGSISAETGQAVRRSPDEAAHFGPVRRIGGAGDDAVRADAADKARLAAEREDDEAGLRAPDEAN